MLDLKQIWNWIKKNISMRDIVIFLIIISLFFLTRLIRLDRWPIFSDEGIYIHWAKVAWKDAGQRFISVTDGRQPLQTWGTIPFLKLFPNNALLAGRLFSVTTGFVALLGTLTISFYLWGKRAAFIAGFLYIFMPFFLFYDRMALVDSAVNAGFVWILFFTILLAQTRRLDVALLLGFTGGFSLLAKSSSRMFLMIAAGAPILFISKKKGEFIKKTAEYLMLFGIAAGISLFFYNVQRLSPYFHYVGMKNTTFIMTMAEFRDTPFKYFFNNIQGIPKFVAWESGWVIVLFSLAGMYKMFKNNMRLFLYFLAFFVAPFIGISFFAKVLFPRYLLFYGTLLVLTATYFLHTIKPRMQIFWITALIATMMVFDYFLILNPARASFPEIDRGQYIEGPSAVWGAQELMQYVRERSQEKPALILAEGNFGLVADVLDVYLQEGDQIQIKGLWPLDEQHLYEHQPELEDRQVFVVFSHREEFPDHWPIELVEEYEKPGNESSMYLYRLQQSNDIP